MTNTYNLISLAQKGDKEAEKRLIDDNLPLVHSCVRKLMRAEYEYEDLLQVGCIGLVKAVRRFDVTSGYRLSTYAVPIIMGEIKRFVRDNTQVKVSRGLRELWTKAMGVRGRLATELLREPSIGEIADCLNTDVEKLTLAMEACMPCESLQQKIGGDSRGEIYLADTVKSSYDVDKELEKIALKKAIETLSEREKKIIILRYFKGKTQTEVSEVIGVSQVQISRIEKNVLSVLRKFLE